MQGRVDEGLALERERLAREALEEFTRRGDVGALLDEQVEDDGVVTLHFAATMPGYPGWRWTVSLAQVEGEDPTVLESELLPGDGSLVAPDWVPWSERLEEWRAQQAAEAAERGASDDDAGDASAEDADEADDSDDDSDEDEDLDDEDDSDEDDDLDQDDDLDEDDPDDDLGDDVYDGLDPEAAAGLDESEDDEPADRDDRS